MMQPGQKKVLQQPIQPAMRTAFGQGKGMDWADGAVQTLFGSNGASAGQTLFGTGSASNKEVPSLAILATDVLLIGVKIRETPNLGQADQLKKLLMSYIKDFERTCLSHGKTPEAVEQAKYALAAFIDETVINSENNCRETWIADPLATSFFNDSLAGENFFKRLEALLPDLKRNLEAIEVYYFALALGFQGRYRLSGPEVLPNVVRNLLKRIEGLRGAPSKAVSPSAYVHPGVKGREKSGRPLIFGSALFLVVSVLLYVLLMFASDGALDPARETLERLQSRVPTP
ncbi:MAG: type IVB secretion system protein IcmH/DotU [Fibrobacterota bacterium]|nr:type IVB secretion system protein IcmH/DotU [Fibrobacterota bacterium]